MNQKQKLRKILSSNNLEFALEAFNSLSAIIAEEAGFKCLWVGSLGVSASLGIKDDSEISWSEMVSNVDNICDCVDVPIIVDIDSGYGDPNIVSRVVKKLQKVGAAGVCIEDKIFPKMNSFINKNQKLISSEEFCDKLKSIRKSVSKEFVVVARLEGFIVNASLQEILNRAKNYMEAGADALVIHSKKETAEDIKAFMKYFNYKIPIIIIPTTYYKEGINTFKNLGISMVIWANHLTRACVKSMQEVACQINYSKNVDCIEEDIASIDEIFRLQNKNKKDDEYGRQGSCKAVDR